MSKTILTSLLALFLVVPLAGCGDKPSKDDCSKLLDHMVELAVSEAGTDQLTPEMEADLEEQKKGLHEHLKSRFMKQCTDKTPGSFVKCGLKARTPEELAKCSKG